MMAVARSIFGLLACAGLVESHRGGPTRTGGEISASVQPVPAPVWEGGGVTLFPNYTYTATFGVGAPNSVNTSQPQLHSGWYGFRCDGLAVELNATGHTIQKLDTRAPHPTLGASSSATVTLVSTGPTCIGTRLTATFTYYPETESVVFAHAFPDGVARTNASTTGTQGRGTTVASDASATDRTSATAHARGSVRASSSSAHTGTTTCTLQNNVDFHGPNNDIRFIANVTDPGVCCAACVSEPRCVAFSLMGSADAGKSWAKRCYLKSNTQGRGASPTHVSGTIPGRGPSPWGHPVLPASQASAFPLFGPVAEGTQFLTWNGDQFFPAQWGPASTASVSGGAPYVLFDGTVPHGDGVVLSTYDEHFTAGCDLSQHGVGCGVTVAVPSIAKGYSCASVVTRGGGGVTNLTMAWGAALQKAHNTSRAMTTTDVVTTKLGYWTDNQAYYDWYHWFPNVSREGKPQNVLLAIDAELTSKNLTAHYYQLDAYWYKLEIKPACCVVDWTAVSDQFPQGLEWLSNKLGKSMMLYTDTFCNDTIYRRSDGGNWTFMDADPVHISWFDGYVANVAPEESYSFYTALMQRGKQQGMGAFEIDFLNYNFALFPRFREEPGAHAQWLKGMDDAAADIGVSIQYCMTLPQQMLNSVTLQTVTSSRVSGDGGRPYFHGGPGQLLAAALGVRPFKDNAWTTGVFPKGLADIVGSVLTMGPVGLADALNTTNATVAATACARDGTLLHPSRPATPIDATFLPGGLEKGSVMVAHFGPTDSTGTPPWYVVVATGATTSVARSDLWPAPPTQTDYMWFRKDWNGGACIDGAPASQCLTPMATVPVTAESSAVELYYIAPVLPGGWVVLGEPGKVVPVSFARVANISTTTDAVTVWVKGAPNEEVAFLFARTTESPLGDNAHAVGNVASRSLTLPPSGVGQITFSDY